MMTTNHTQESYKQNFLKTPKGEWNLRDLLVDVDHSLPGLRLKFRSSDTYGRADFEGLHGFADELFQSDGVTHDKQSKKDTDAFMVSKAIQDGFRVWRFKEEEVLYCAAQVKQILASLAVMKRILLERRKKC